MLKNTTLLNSLKKAKNNSEKLFAVLIDPDKYSQIEAKQSHKIMIASKPDVVLVGGSLVSTQSTDLCIKEVKSVFNLPTFLFPGSPIQYSSFADGLLFLSLISGRNADLLIGRHVEIAPTLSQSTLEIIPTGYMLIEGGRTTSATYMSNSLPIPADKWDIAVATAQAGVLLGLQCIYLDAGSGALQRISLQMIEKVAKSISVPLIIGGGIRTQNEVNESFAAGADMVVVGTAFENNSFEGV